MKVQFPFLRTARGKQIALSLFLIFVSTLVIDQVTKRHAHRTLLTEESPTNLDQYRSTFHEVGTIGSESLDPEHPTSFARLKFHYQRNRGAAFSMLATLDDSYRIPFFYGVTILSVTYILFYLRTLPINYHLTRFGLVMIMAGAIGNFIDRIIQGYVIDFVDVSWNILGFRHDFAVFNVADIAINIGIIAFILEMILKRKPVYAAFQKSSDSPVVRTPEKA
ncbi:MAG: signal peptidase II [Chitinophagaceae bacterium]|nr:signal peptidase II [Oligoflexus sp.]